MTGARTTGVPTRNASTTPTQRALKLLEEALALLDGDDARPEIGARLNEVIVALRTDE